MVNYQTKDNAISKGLAYVQSDGTTVMTVDPNSTLSSGEYRDSVRVSSKNTYSNGLIIADIWAMPHGCSVWPAYWMVGPSWPSDGEIDILEGVNGEFSFIHSLLPQFSLFSLSPPYNFFLLRVSYSCVSGAALLDAGYKKLCAEIKADPWRAAIIWFPGPRLPYHAMTNTFSRHH